jgi:hypothetical protein
MPRNLRPLLCKLVSPVVEVRREGIVIFGDYRSHRHAARQPGLAAPTPELGEWISVRLTRQ